ncbi:uncharacterized protein [Engystomops pustulosus]|uniref:uncharacterized protein isoform X1 n=2 Tax=Engystomops pustulosus TaxID=76066 RepID=UPI003AFA555B
MTFVDPIRYRSPIKNILMYQSDEFDSGFPSSSTSSFSGVLENELKKEVNRSEKRRSMLADSLRNAYHAIEYQKNCLEQQDRYFTSSKSTLESLLMKQELLESRLSNLKQNNFYPSILSLGVSEKNLQQSSRYPPEVKDYSRITALEREISDIKEQMRCSKSVWGSNNAYTQNMSKDGKSDEVEVKEVNEELRQHAELMEAKCSNAQRERDVLELQIVSLHSGLHQEKVTSKELEKKCVKLQSEITANRSINESLHLEVSALKQQSHTLENAVKGSESEKKLLHVKVENLQKEKQILMSQKDLLFEIMKKKGKWKYLSKELTRRDPEVIQTIAGNERGCSGETSFSDLSHTASLRHSGRRGRRMKERKYKSNGPNFFQSHDCHTDYDRKYLSKEKDGNARNKQTQLEKNEIYFKDENSSGKYIPKNVSKICELNTDIIVACYQHLSELLSKLECLKMNNVILDNEKEQILKFLLRMINDFQDYKRNNENSREKVEKLLNEHTDLRENYHKRMNQVTAVIIELKHLRQAYNGLLKCSQDPDDKKAMQWISRVQKIKDALKLLLEEQSLNPIPLMKQHHITQENK